MTSHMNMGQSAEENTDKSDNKVDTEKTKKLQKKLKAMGLMPSAVQVSDEDITYNHKNKTVFSPFFMVSPTVLTVLLAFSVAGVFSYFYMGKEIGKFFTSNQVTESASETNQAMNQTRNLISIDPDNTPSADISYSGKNNQPVLQQPDQGDMQSHALYQSQNEAWRAKQQSEFEQRRDEYYRRNAMNNSQSWASTKLSSAPTPQWVKDRQAEIEKQRTQYIREIDQQQTNRATHGWSNNSVPENSPATNNWNGNRQTINNRTSNSMSGNELSNDHPTQSSARGYIRPEYFSHPGMNVHPPTEMTNSNTAQNPQYGMEHQPPQMQYYNSNVNRPQEQYYYAPSPGYGAYNVPYGNDPYGWQQGRGYR